jgi:hypothetical protein
MPFYSFVGWVESAKPINPAHRHDVGLQDPQLLVGDGYRYAQPILRLGTDATRTAGSESLPLLKGDLEGFGLSRSRANPTRSIRISAGGQRKFHNDSSILDALIPPGVQVSTTAWTQGYLYPPLILCVRRRISP